MAATSDIRFYLHPERIPLGIAGITSTQKPQPLNRCGFFYAPYFRGFASQRNLRTQCYAFGIFRITRSFFMSTHLDRLLFAQGGQCFFCRKALPKAEASVEHLVASANGGLNDDGNCVACCKALNHLLGAKSIKEKMQIILNQRGNFQCPGNIPTQLPTVASPTPPAPTSSPKPITGNGNIAAIDLVLADLKKRGASRPRKVSTLSSTVKALLKQQQKPNTDAEVAKLIAELQRRGKVVVTDTNVTYKLG